MGSGTHLISSVRGVRSVTPRRWIVLAADSFRKLSTCFVLTE